MKNTPFHYFDYNATTPVAQEVLDAMLPFLRNYWGNPSSVYGFGRQLVKHLDFAREQVAALIKADPKEVIFTSGGTESINTALQSALLTQPEKRHIVTTQVEHSATLNACAHLKKRGFEITHLPVIPLGALDLTSLEAAIRPDTALVSIMLANNETGVIFPISEIAAICRRKGVLLHTDAVQAAGRIPLNVDELGVDLLSLSAHKLHAPKGVGMLYVRRHTPFWPHIIGGGQEKSRRGGTENVAGIVGFGRAAELAMRQMQYGNAEIRGLRDRMESSLLCGIPHSFLNGAPEPRLPNTSNIAFEGIEAEAALIGLDQAGICASSGSACTTGSLSPSHVLRAMGLSPELSRGSLRFSLGRQTTPADVGALQTCLPPLIEKLRSMSANSK